MRVGLPHLLTILFALILTACGDLPTTPSPDAGPMLYGACVPNSDGVYVCPPIGNATCDPYHYDCGPGDCIMSPTGGDETVQNCPIGGGAPVGPGAPPPTGGGGGASPPDTCQTGDPVLDSPAVRQMLSDLWQRSNPTAPQPQRLEQAGWIVQNPDGSFGTMPFTGITAQGPCEINGNLYAPPNAVAWVHTHPFERREVQVVCGPVQEPDPATGGPRNVIGPDGQVVYPVYYNRPSNRDRVVLETINIIRAGENRALLAGLIIDSDRITVYTEDQANKHQPFPRCGY